MAAKDHLKSASILEGLRCPRLLFIIILKRCKDQLSLDKEGTLFLFGKQMANKYRINGLYEGVQFQYFAGDVRNVFRNLASRDNPAEVARFKGKVRKLEFNSFKRY